MPRKVHNKLTPVSVRNAKCGINAEGKPYALRHADGGGLYLLVKPSGARSWTFRATAAGKVRYIGLGSAAGPNAVSLADAREAAREKAKEVAAGIVPVSDRRKQKREAKVAEQSSRISNTTFRDSAESYLSMNESGWKNDKHRKQWRSTLETYAFPHFGDLPVGEVATEHVMAALKPIWNEKPETANRVRGRIERILDAAKVEGLREGENPARWRGHLDNVLPKPTKAKRRRNEQLGRTGHHAAMPYAAVPEFMASLAERESIAALALEFTILTAARTGETIGATWREIDLEGAVWTIPASRMKAEAEHTVPLSSRALELLRQVQPLAVAKGDIADRPLFPSSHGGGLSNMAMLMQLRRMVEGFTVHGFRSSFRDWAAECTGFTHEVCEMALAHTIGNKAEAAYRRGALMPKRRKLMEAWAEYCAGKGAAGEIEDNVTPIRA
ncbi:integrase arm-type DNA-binding domain-containing protein [Qipengyuania sp. 1XM1-15A]|uniref:tyrosine-type recombinase/integrase n=1 Tax=Qipengyuania xiamenensis TaxID=2867237 RepID=UPI001C87D00F|nr:site-specific integrase [Qipengyuania xiamenensis]MBX7533549.1 integrase arm-type DNA-binding domain-containing protein [Qipengyuania xiamenensis]